MGTGTSRHGIGQQDEFESDSLHCDVLVISTEQLRSPSFVPPILGPT